MRDRPFEAVVCTRVADMPVAAVPSEAVACAGDCGWKVWRSLSTAPSVASLPAVCSQCVAEMVRRFEAAARSRGTVAGRYDARKPRGGE